MRPVFIYHIYTVTALMLDLFILSKGSSRLFAKCTLQLYLLAAVSVGNKGRWDNCGKIDMTLNLKFPY